MPRAASALLVAAVLGSCSLTTSSNDACASTSECRSAFGLGSACGEDGYCHETVAHARCDRTFPSNLLDDPSAFGDAFVIGAIADESLDTHRARQNAVQLAFSEARDQGGLDGRAVGVVFCTNEVDPSIDALDQDTATVAVMRYLIDDLAVPAVVGPPSSDSAAAAFEAATATDTLVISPSATSNALTELEPTPTDARPGLLWRTVPPDALQGRVIADDLAARSITRLALIVEDSSYGNGLADAIQARYGDATRFTFATASARNSVATMAGSMEFEEVVFISSQTSDSTAFLLFAETFDGYDDKNVFLTDAAKNQDLLNDAAAAAALFPRVRGSAPAPLAGVTYEAFLASYRAEFGDEADAFSFTAHAYDAAWLTLVGASWALLQEPDLTGRSIARGLRRVTGGVPVRLGPTALADTRERFLLGEDIDLEGASGALDYDAAEEETRAPVEVWTIASDGEGFVSEYEVTP